MRQTAKLVATAASIVTLLGSLTLTPISVSQAKSAVEKGRDIAFNRKKGNCLACHMIKGGTQPGNMGPPLIGIGKRYTKEKLRAQIWDATKKNPNSPMPPFGRHKILTDKEIDLVVEFIHTL